MKHLDKNKQLIVFCQEMQWTQEYLKNRSDTQMYWQMKNNFAECYLLKQIFQIWASKIRLHGSELRQEGRISFIKISERGFKIVYSTQPSAN